jgi:hypothetical protein
MRAGCKMHSRRPILDFYTVAASRKYQQPGSFTYWPTGRINAPHMYSTAFLHNWRQSDRDWVNAFLMTSFIEVIICHQLADDKRKVLHLWRERLWFSSVVNSERSAVLSVNVKSTTRRLRSKRDIVERNCFGENKIRICVSSCAARYHHVLEVV